MTKPETSTDTTADTATATDAGTAATADSTAEAKVETGSFSAEQVTELIKKAKAQAGRSAERRVRAEMSTKTETQPPEQATQPPNDQLTDLMSKVESLGEKLLQSENDRSFAERIQGLAVTDKQRNVLRNAYSADDSSQFDSLVDAFGITAGDATQPETEAAPTYQSPGGVSAPPVELTERDATRWTRDHIDRMKENGTFLSRLEQYRDSLPGGGNGVFRRRIPKVK